MQFIFNKSKTINSALFIIDSLNNSKINTDFHKIFKILYFADQKHLTIYGRPISGDIYMAMENGPVPSYLYDIFKFVRGDSLIIQGNEYKAIFEIYNKYCVRNKTTVDFKKLSKSEINLLTQSINENKDLSFSELTNKSHDTAWKEADEVDNSIDYKKIAMVSGIDEEMTKYISLKIENQKFSEFLR